MLVSPLLDVARRVRVGVCLWHRYMVSGIVFHAKLPILGFKYRQVIGWLEVAILLMTILLTCIPLVDHLTCPMT